MNEFLQRIPIIDAHHHLWRMAGNNYPKFIGPPGEFFLGDYSALARDFLPADYRAISKRHNVVATVHVEAEWHRHDQAGETAWVDALARDHGLPDVLVGHAWFDDPRVEQVLERVADLGDLFAS